MKTKVYNVVILDQSGSMEEIKYPTISGFNELLQTIKSSQVENKETQEHNITLVTFNDSENIKVVNDCSNVLMAQELNNRTYNPDRCTALYDAMGQTLTRIERLVDSEEMAIGMVTVLTDGYENASREYTGEAIRKLVGRLREKGWHFTYIGANQDVEKMAAKMNINHMMSFDCNEEDTRRMWKEESGRRSSRYMHVEHALSCMAPEASPIERKARLKKLFDEEKDE